VAKKQFNGKQQHHQTAASAASYDPLQFRIRAKDDAGHYEKLQTQVPPELDTEIKSLVASGMFDFDGVGGFIRWAAVNGIEFLRGYRPEYPSQISIVRAISLENARSEVRREFLTQLESTAKEAFELAGRGFPAEAAKHVQRVINYVRQLSPEDPWRAIFIEEIKQRFGHLLKQGKVSSFVPAEDQQQLSQWDIM
jgi:hypothetical protein